MGSGGWSFWRDGWRGGVARAWLVQGCRRGLVRTGWARRGWTRVVGLARDGEGGDWRGARRHGRSARLGEGRAGRGGRGACGID
jgi:hypothetical protein